jgi:hypothetical protein
MNGTNQTTPWVALHYWHYLSSPPNAANLATFCSSWLDAWGTALKAAFSTGVSVQNVEAWDLSSRTGATASGGLAVTGTRAGTLLPTSSAACVGWKVNYRWRGGHPRTYWPAGVDTDLTNGHLWTDPAQSFFQTANNAWLAAVNALTIGGAGGYLTCVRYVHSPVKGEPSVYFNPPLDLRIESALVDKRLDTQRRRLGPDL